ncbi:hypothetical protein BC829DRAFT_223258 [Chytridium lagenaria]|nr:hypothetical protein BC829DRAFT_223258 [Chytridium lagenaria]
MRRRGAGSAVDGQSDSTSEYGDNRNVAAPLGLTQRPTLPDIDVDLDAPVMKGSTIGTSGGDGYAKSEFGGSTVYAPNNYGGPRYGGYAPPMPQPSGFSDTSSDYGGAPYRGGPPPSGPGPNRQPYNPTPMQGGYRPHNPQWGYGAPNMPYGQGAPLPPPMRSTSPNFSEFAQGAPPMSNRAYQGPPQGAPRAMTPQGAPPQGAPPQMRYAGSEAGSDHGDQWGGSQGGMEGIGVGVRKVGVDRRELHHSRIGRDID